MGNGMGGSEREIKGEFSSNGVENDLSHTRGAISMARSQMKDSASSQFFIVHEDSTFICPFFLIRGSQIIVPFRISTSKGLYKNITV